MKHRKRRKLVTHERAVCSGPAVPKVTVEITGANGSTRSTIECAIVRALQEITPVTAKWVPASE